ncbi:MAG: dihydroneopterin aldolase [Alphaproteobacteria bacterium]|nr:dihydroneopterin aldolase [Alphaproteobacteria bacterium]
MTIEYTRLIVRDLRVSMPIGIYEQDKKETCALIINLTADVQLPENWVADRYENVVCYARLRQMVLDVTGQGHLNLVETLAETIAARCFEWPQVSAVTVRVEKASIFPDCIPGVEIARVRPR